MNRFLAGVATGVIGTFAVAAIAVEVEQRRLTRHRAAAQRGARRG